VKHAFAEAGIPLRPIAGMAGAVKTVGVGTAKAEHPAKGPEASFTWGRSSGEIISNEVLMFWDTESAAELATEMSLGLAPARLTHVANVLIIWAGTEPPALRAAIRRLS